MNTVLDNKLIEEMECGTNFSCVLGDSTAFLSMEYKVLQSQANNNFVKCMKMSYNGKVQLFYLTGTLKPLSSMLPSLDPDSFLTICANLLANIINVRQNGFLSCRNVNISLDRIYVDPTNYKVSLVYLPLRTKLYDDNPHFENDLRTSLVKVISKSSGLRSPKTINFAGDLTNGVLTIDDLYARIKGGSKGSASGGKSTIGSSGKSGMGGSKGEGTPAERTGKLRLVAKNAPNRVEIDVTKSPFVLGRNAAAVDGIISFNNKIGRIHCRIERRGNQYAVTDLKATNGTYVNDEQLTPHVPKTIHNGDILRLANSEFHVIIQ